MERRPAVKFCIPFAAGIVLGWVTDVPPIALLLITITLFALTIFLPPRGGSAMSLRTPWIYLLLISFGFLRMGADLRLTGREELALHIPSDTIIVTGMVAGLQGRSERSARYLVDCESLRRGDSTIGVTGRIMLHLGYRLLETGVGDSLFAGRRITARGSLRRPKPARNPGDMSWEAYFRLGDIAGEMRLRRPGEITTGAVDRSGFVNAFVVPVRRELSERMVSLVDDNEARFLNGLILGERNEVPGDLKADFITVGVMHLLAISGQQVVIVALLIAGLLTALRVPGKARFLLVSLALIYYVFLTGNSPSVTRAGIMSVVLLGSTLAQRKQDIFNALAIAAMIVLLLDPRQLFDPGFLLSFSAVIAIVTLYPLIISLTEGYMRPITANRFLDLLWKGAAVSLAAGLGTAPIVAYYFGRVSLVGFLANIFIVPMSSLALVLGMVTLAASFASAWLAGVYAAGAEWVAWVTFKLVEFFAGFPFAMVRISVTLFSLSGFYIFIILSFSLWQKKKWAGLIITGLVLLNLLLYGTILRAGGGSVLRVTFLDVGQGDAAFLEFPGGETMLIDAGPRTFSYDTGERIILPYLQRRDIDRIDYLVVSHPHSDHLGGFPHLLRTIGVGRVLEGGAGSRSSLYAEFEKLADSLGVERLRLHRGGKFPQPGGTRIYVLHPDSAGGAGWHNLNEASLSLKLQYGGTNILFPGDAEGGAEAMMASAFGGFLKSDILKSGHHGSITSSTGRFLALVSPATSVVSVGEGNKFGHPSGIVMESYRSRGTAIVRTDRDGAAVYESDGVSWRRVEWR